MQTHFPVNTPLLLLFVLFSVYAKAQKIELLQQSKPTSIRGLSVVDDKTAWLSGSKGYVAQTNDGGKTWAWQQVKGYEQADFRSINAFSSKEAIIMSSGTPALILKTTNGGITWTEKYRNTDTSCFFDAMTFANAKHGFILGDPIKNKFLLLETIDGGNNWALYKNQPAAFTGEAAFAASGTCLRMIKQRIIIVSGGPVARLFSIDLHTNKWTVLPIDIKKGKSSQGAFSITIAGNQLVAAGGDYSNDKATDSTACYSTNNGKNWHLATQSPSGYQSCVEYISGTTFLSTGTPGTNITTDGGKTWTKIDDSSFNVCHKAKHGNLILLAGNNGKVGILKP